MSADPDARRPTVAIYDRPPWWRTRRFLRIGLVVLVVIASIAVWISVVG